MVFFIIDSVFFINVFGVIIVLIVFLVRVFVFFLLCLVVIYFRVLFVLMRWGKWMVLLKLGIRFSLIFGKLMEVVVFVICMLYVNVIL